MTKARIELTLTGLWGQRATFTQLCQITPDIYGTKLPEKISPRTKFRFLEQTKLFYSFII